MADAREQRRHPPTEAALLRPAPLPPPPAATWCPQSYSQAAHLDRLFPWLLEESAQASASGGMRLSFGPPPREPRPGRSLGFAATEAHRVTVSPQPPVRAPQREPAAEEGHGVPRSWIAASVVLAVIAVLAWLALFLYAGGLHAGGG